MYKLTIDKSGLLCFIDFLTLYLRDGPKIDDVKNFIEHKLNERDIPRSYQNALVTQDEVCSFILSHLYTEYVMDSNAACDIDEKTVEEFHKKIKKQLF